MRFIPGTGYASLPSFRGHIAWKCCKVCAVPIFNWFCQVVSLCDEVVSKWDLSREKNLVLADEYRLTLQSFPASLSFQSYVY